MKKKDSWPERWGIDSLESVVEKITNGINLPQLETTIENSFPISRIETIANETVDFNRVKYVSIDEAGIEKYALQKGDILFSHINSDKHLGKTAIFEEERTLIHGVNLLLIRANSRYNKKLLNYLFKHYRFQGKFIEVAQRAVNQSSINQKKLKAFTVPIIELPEQQRIVARLDALFGHLDSLREKLDRMPVLLKNFRQQVLTQAVTGELIQEDMEIVSLGEYLEDIKYGTSQKSEYGIEGIPTLRIPNIDVQRGEISVSDMKYSNLEDKEYDKLKLKKGDLLIIRSNGSITLVGQSAIISEEEVDFGYAGYLVRLRTTNDLDPSYLNYILKSNYLRGQIVEMARSTSGVNNINTTEIKSLKIPLTSIQNQKRIVDQIKIIFAVVDKIESQYASLKAKIDQLPQAILAKAFRGELVRQKVKEYVVEEIEGLMAAEPKEGFGEQ